MSALTEWGPGEREAVIDHLHAHGVHGGYGTPLEKAMESLESGEEGTAVGALLQVVAILGGHDGDRMSDAPHRARTVALEALGLLGAA